MSITVNVFVLLYFALIGWICEVKICDCHEEFLVEKLRCPWLILIAFAKKIFNTRGSKRLTEAKIWGII